MLIICFLVLYISFIFDQKQEKTDVEFQNEESDFSDEVMHKSDLSEAEESVDNADNLVIGCGHEHADYDIPSGNSHLSTSNDFHGMSK